MLSPHAVRVFSLWILLYWKHQETTRKSINRLMDALEELKQAKRYEQLKRLNHKIQRNGGVDNERNIRRVNPTKEEN